MKTRRRGGRVAPRRAARRPQRPRHPGDRCCVAPPRARPRRLALPPDAASSSRLRETPPTSRRSSTLARRHGRHLVFRSGGTSLSGQAITDDLLIDTRAGFRSVRSARRRGQDPAAARRDRAARQRAARPQRPQTRPRSGERNRLHDRRRRRQQFQRNGVWHRAQHLPDPRVDGRRASERHHRRHRRPGCRGAPRASRAAACRRPAHTARAGARRPRLGRNHQADVRDQEHDGIRAQLLRRLRESTAHPRAPHDRQRRDARFHRLDDLPHRRGAPLRDDGTRGLRRPRRRDRRTRGDRRVRRGDDRAARCDLAAGRPSAARRSPRDRGDSGRPARRSPRRVPGRRRRRTRRGALRRERSSSQASP